MPGKKSACSEKTGFHAHPHFLSCTQFEFMKLILMILNHVHLPYTYDKKLIQPFIHLKIYCQARIFVFIFFIVGISLNICGASETPQVIKPEKTGCGRELSGSRRQKNCPAIRSFFKKSDQKHLTDKTTLYNLQLLNLRHQACLPEKMPLRDLQRSTLFCQLPEPILSGSRENLQARLNNPGYDVIGLLLFVNMQIFPMFCKFQTLGSLVRHC